MAVHRNWVGAVKRSFIVRRSSASPDDQNRCSMRLGSNLVEEVRRRFSRSSHPQKPSIVFNHTNNRETFTNDEDVDEEEKEQTNSQEHIIEYSQEVPVAVAVAVVDASDDGGFATASASAASSPSQDFLSLKKDLAAIMIQASFRGHLARRAYRALRSLVRLQAVVRGAQVRSQARIALNCMHALVRLQCRIRERQVLTMSSPELSCQV